MMGVCFECSSVFKQKKIHF